MKYLVANWKAHKTKNDVIAWLHVFKKFVDDTLLVQKSLNENQIQIILCPSSPFLDIVSEQIKNYRNISVGAQDISMLDKGSYTGEVPAYILSPLVKYAIIGHSERRKYFEENNEMISKKLTSAQQYNITPLLCISEVEHMISPRLPFICYEPVHAIGTGNNESLEKVLTFKSQLHITPQQVFLYGGSVNKHNVRDYLCTNEIQGSIMGTASLDPHEFNSVLSNLCSP